MSDPNVTRGDKVITGSLYVGGDIINAGIASMAPVILAIPEKTPINAVASAAKLTSSGAMVPGKHATSTLTSDGTNFDAEDTITINLTVYTFKADPTGIAYAVDIGGSAQVSLANLRAAINATGTPNTEYGAGTVAHPTVVAASSDATTLVAVVRLPGTASNAEVTESTDANAAWTGADFANGTAAGVATTAATITIGTRVYTVVNELSETAGADAIVDQILYGGNEATMLDNMLLAINADATAGTNYSTGTVVNANVTATTNTNTTQVIAAKVKGVIGDLIAIDESMANTVWDDPAGTLGTEVAGVNGTVGVANELCADATYLYHSIAANTIADANWRRVALGSVY